MNTFGERLYAARKAAGLSQRELGAVMGMTAMAISKYERGQLHASSKRRLQFGEALGVKAGWFGSPARQITLTGGSFSNLGGAW